VGRNLVHDVYNEYLSEVVMREVDEDNKKLKEEIIDFKIGNVVKAI